MLADRVRDVLVPPGVVHGAGVAAAESSVPLLFRAFLLLLRAGAVALGSFSLLLRGGGSGEEKTRLFSHLLLLDILRTSGGRATSADAAEEPPVAGLPARRNRKRHAFALVAARVGLGRRGLDAFLFFCFSFGSDFFCSK